MENDRLRRQLINRGIEPDELATAVEVDPKTVERWIALGRVPHQRHRARTAQVLDVDEWVLWPELSQGGAGLGVAGTEVVAVYPHRGAVPHDLRRHLVEGAQHHLDLLVYSGLFLVDSYPDLPTKLIERASDGLQARLLYGDPDSQTVAWRGQEEGIGANLAARIRLSLTYMGPVVGVDGIAVRQHDSILYNSLYRFDDEMLVNTHVTGSPAPTNPVLHLRKTDDGQMFGHYLQSFDRVWSDAPRVSPASQS